MVDEIIDAVDRVRRGIQPIAARIAPSIPLAVNIHAAAAPTAAIANHLSSVAHQGVTSATCGTAAWMTPTDSRMD